MPSKTAKFSSPELTAAAKAVADLDRRIGDALAAMQRLADREASQAAELSDLRAQAAQEARSGDFEASDRLAHAIATKTAGLEATRSARQSTSDALAELVAEGERMERQARNTFADAFALVRQAMTEELQADLRDRLSKAWSAAVYAGIEIDAQSWFRVALGNVVAGIRLVPADAVAPGAPKTWPRCERLEAARAMLAPAVEDAA